MRIILIYNSTGNILRTVIYDSRNNRIYNMGSNLGWSCNEIEFKLTQSNMKRYMKDEDMVNLKNIEKDRKKGILS